MTIASGITKLVISTLALTIIGALALPASAQSNETGSRLRKKDVDHRKVAAFTKAERVAEMTATCFAKKYSDEARSFLQTLPGSDSEGEQFSAMINHIEKCMPDMAFENVGNQQSARGTLKMSIAPSTLRGALSEALLEHTEMSLAPAALQLGDDGMYVPDNYFGRRPESAEQVFALGFAGCVMGNNHQALAGLFATEAGSQNERKAIMAMAPSFSQCVMDGQTLKLDPSRLRFSLAEVTYYALMANERDGGQKKAAAE